jgi:hypothetical protein
MGNAPSSRAVTARLRCFTRALGWNGLRKFTRETSTAPGVLTWYEAGDANGGRTHCALQINEHPIGSQESFSVAVYAARYRLCSGWHAFNCVDAGQAKQEALRLSAWIAHEWFSTPHRRRAYRLAHPECVGYSWERLRVSEPPYFSGAAPGE